MKHNLQWHSIAVPFVCHLYLYSGYYLLLKHFVSNDILFRELKIYQC